jgi:peptidoglycan/xylan/chitin deacetylase (PgdA/CDA1 family)
VLVTFDDAYASVAEVAAPLCWNYGVPAVFFVNASNLNAQQLALDNLICHLTNVRGLGTINNLIRAIGGMPELECRSMAEIFSKFLPGVSLHVRRKFQEALLALVSDNERALAKELGLYLTSEQVRKLAGANFEIGNHTYTHVHCRWLSEATFFEEIDRNRAELEAMSGTRVRAFSLPYGSAADLTERLAKRLRVSGYEAVFLSESVANSPNGKGFQFDRVSTKAKNESDFFAEIEVLPRFRALRNVLTYRRKAQGMSQQTISN